MTRERTTGDINTDDCKVLQQFNVAQQTCIKPKVYTDLQMPHIIAPNGAGINDVFEVKKIDGIISMHTEIYNRWGVKLFATDNIDVKWDGASCADGVYYWMIKYFDANDEHKTLTGFVNLMR